MIWFRVILKILARRNTSDKVFCDKTFNTANNQQKDGYQRELALMAYKFFDKKLKGRALAIRADRALACIVA